MGFDIQNEKSQQDILPICGKEKGKHKFKNNRTAGNVTMYLDTEALQHGE